MLGFLEWGVYLLDDVGTNCIDSGEYTNNFWYFWSSDGSNGTLLGLVQRPHNLELRIARYTYSADSGHQSTVTRQLLNSSEFHMSADQSTVTMGPLTMSPTGVVGTLANITVNVPFDFSSKHHNDFVSPLVLDIAKKFVPNPASQYGSVKGGGRVGAVTLPAGQPVVKTTYPIPIGLPLLSWAMISAKDFEAVEGDDETVDLQVV